jgi:CheY-like chemotaxis protein
MDVRMPEVDGLQAVNYIRAKPMGGETRIIALTATAFEEDLEHIMASGCDDFLRKPFREADVFNMLEKYLDLQFIYEEIETAQVMTTREGETPQICDLAVVPADLIAELRQATITAEMDQMLTVIDKISNHDPDLALQLKTLTLNFEYKKILALITNPGDEK